MIVAMSKWINVGPADEKRADSTFFGLSLPFRRSASPAAPEPQRLTLSQIKLRMELSFQDVEGMPADRLRLKVRCAREVKELWQLRSDIHQLLARHTNQQAASQRINDLLPCFEGWIPARQRVRI